MRGVQAIVKRIHLTLGLILALPVFILGISGSVLVLDIHPRVPPPAPHPRIALCAIARRARRCLRSPIGCTKRYLPGEPDARQSACSAPA